MKVGGRAEWLVEPAHPDEFVAAYEAAREMGHVPRVLGGGANLLIGDGLIPGVVLTTERMGRVFRPTEDGAEPGVHAGGEEGMPFESELPPLRHPDEVEVPRLVAWAGAGMPGLVRAARELGWTGLEGLVGVPGHLGGGVAMNAGGRWGELWDVVEEVRVLDPERGVETRRRDECEPSYRNGNLGGAIVLGAVLRLAHGQKDEIKERMRDYLAQKSAAQPVTERSSGCIFKNPDPETSDGRSAGQLVEDCGGKGLSRGDAIVSPKHGNFIVNRGEATAVDVMTLIEDLKCLVLEKSGVELVTEVKVWGAES